MVRRRRARGGFTLVELLVSMALSTVGLLGLLSLQMIAIDGNMRSRSIGEAVAIAQDRLESAERAPYASLPALQEPPTVTAQPSPTTYARQTRVVANADNTTDVEVVVSWSDTRNVAHSVRLVTKRSP